MDATVESLHDDESTEIEAVVTKVWVPPFCIVSTMTTAP
jgi:hypothetical protein